MPHSLPHRQPGGDEAAKSRSSSSSSSSSNNNTGPSSAIPGHRSLPQTKQPDDTKELSPCLMGEEHEARTLPQKERTEATAADEILCAPSSPGNTNNRSHRAAPDRKTLEPNTLPLDVAAVAAAETEAASREPRVPRRKERLETTSTESSASSVSSTNPILPPSVATQSLMQLILTNESRRKRSPVEGSGVDAMLVEPSLSDNPPHSASHESKKRGHQRSKPNVDVNMDSLASVGTLNNTATCDVEGASAERTEALANVEEGKSTTTTTIAKVTSPSKGSEQDANSEKDWDTMGVDECRVPLKSAAKSAASVNQQDREYQEAAASQKEEPKRVSVHYREDFKKRSDVIGVGYNRIRIEPLREERTKGSAADIVVQKLLVQYDSTKAKETGVQAGLEAPNKELLPEDIEEGDKKPSAEPTLMGATADSTEMASKRQVAPFVHNMGIFSDPKSLQAAPRKDESIAPPITLGDEERINQLIRVMRDVPKDTKLDIINRRTGRVLRGDAGMTPSELAEQMQLDVALEPMVAIRPGESDSILVSSRASRILTDRNFLVRSGVRRQTRLGRPFRKGDIVSVTSGEHKNMIGEFDQSLPAGWVSIKQIVPLDGPSAVIVQASVVQRHDSKESRRHSIQEGKRKRRKIISEEEVEQIFLNSVESSLKSVPGKGGLDTHTEGGSSTHDLQLGLSSRQTALKYVVEAFGRKDF